MKSSDVGQLSRLAFVIPVYNDWVCLESLLDGLKTARLIPENPLVIIVDDGSTEPPPAHLGTAIPGHGSTLLVTLNTNVGHQRAIAAGLVTAALDQSIDAVIVMDADGEDRPADCDALWSAHVQHPACIVVAQRKGRTESVPFRFFYRVYRMMFRSLTGQRLDFGNFSLLPKVALQRLVVMPELWNHYPATVMKSRMTLERVPLHRGQRFFGNSRMNFIGLVNHGMAGISAFADTVYARLLAWSAVAAGLLGLTIALGVAFRLTSESPLPGWFALGATAALIALIQLIAALMVVSFLGLSLRSFPIPPPTSIAPLYISEQRIIGV